MSKRALFVGIKDYSAHSDCPSLGAAGCTKVQTPKLRGRPIRLQESFLEG
jgi:hypothetical protein